MPDLHDIIEELGFGRAQVQQIIIGGGVYIADGAEILLIGSVADVVSKEWDFSAAQKGSVVTSVFIGASLGSIMGGWVGDTHGRRVAVLMSLVLVGLLSMLTAVSVGHVTLCAARFLVGVAFGLGMPAWNALSGEIAPVKWRMMCNGASLALFSLGEAYAGILLLAQDPSLKHIHWRSLVIMGGIPGIVLFVAGYFMLVESPVYSAVKGDKRKLLETLAYIGHLNGKRNVDIRDVSVVEERVDDKFRDQIALVLGPELLKITVALCYTYCVMTFVFNGGLYAFPQIFEGLDMSTSAAMNLILGALSELPSLALAMFAGKHLGRKPCLIAAISVNCVSLAGFGWFGHARSNRSESGSDISDGWAPELLVHLFYFGIKFATGSLYPLLFTYASEVYPTEARATGTAVCMAFGRIGSMLAPLIYEHMLEAFGDFKCFFFVAAALCLANLFFIICLPETFGRKLPSRANLSQNLIAQRQLEIVTAPPLEPAVPLGAG